MHIVDGDGGDDGDTRQQMEDGLQSSPVWRLSPGSSSPLVGTRAPHAHTGTALQILKNSFDKTNVASEAWRMEERHCSAYPPGIAQELQSLKDGMNVHGAPELF